MYRSNRLRRGAITLVLLASLAAAAPVRAAAGPGQPVRQLAALPHPHGWLAQLWEMMHAVWGKEGTTLDPSGHH